MVGIPSKSHPVTVRRKNNGKKKKVLINSSYEYARMEGEEINVEER
jgi:hypothetical protein